MIYGDIRVSSDKQTVESLKALFLPQARNKQEADEIKRRLDSLGHEAKAVGGFNSTEDGSVQLILCTKEWRKRQFLPHRTK